MLAIHLRNKVGLTPASTHLSYLRDIPQIAFGSIGFVVIAYVIISATSNAVNLTDGLDGLAAGASAMVFGAFTLIAFLQYRTPACGTLHATAACYTVRDPLDVALVAASAMAACFGFLWWNASPAQIFMGDTGSMALGGLMAGLAIMSHIRTAARGARWPVRRGHAQRHYSNRLVQVHANTHRHRETCVSGWPPLHHHFELGGWEEVTIIVRFWIVAGLAVAFGMGPLLCRLHRQWLAGFLSRW